MDLTGVQGVLALIGSCFLSGLLGAVLRGGGKKAHTCEVHEQTCSYVEAIDARQKEADKKREQTATDFKSCLDSMSTDLSQLRTDVKVFMAEQKVRNESMQVFGKAIEAFSSVLSKQKPED